MTITAYTDDQIEAHLPALVALLTDAVDDGASVSFLAPLAADDAGAFWRGVVADVRGGSKLVWAAEADGEPVGCVHLALASQPNAPHRAEIQKLLVHRAYRRRGLARQLMAAAEQEAQARGRWLLVLDTQAGSGAEMFYTQLGYVRAGVIPQFALSSAGTYDGTVLFYKRLPH